jgi:hypothetical protein
MAPPQVSLPPQIKLDPPLSFTKMILQKQTNAWMASITKIVFLYDENHWDVSWLIEMKRHIYFYRNVPSYSVCIVGLEQPEHSL